MSDTEKNNIPGDEQESLDDDLDSLSLDEKAAFEKIMAEIAAGSGTSPQSQPPEAAESENNVALNTPASATNEGEQENPTAVADDSQHPPEDDDNQSSSEPDCNETKTANQHPMPIDPPVPGALDSADQDQLAEDSRSENTQDDDLSDDQQKALEMIMAEIEAKKGKEAASIISKETENPETGDEDQHGHEDDQDRALNQIMAEIAARKNKDYSESIDDKTGPEGTTEIASDTEQIHPGENSNLSEEEFNDELNQLISSVKHGSAKPLSDHSAESNTEAPAAPESEKAQDSNKYQSKSSASRLAPAPDGMTTSSDTEKSDYNQPEVGSGVSGPGDPDFESEEQQKKGKARISRAAGAPKPKKSRKPAFAVILVCALVFAAGGAYWAYNPINKTTPDISSGANTVTTAPAHTNDSAQTIPVIEQNASSGDTLRPSFQPPAADPLGLVVDELSAARRHVLSKISEITDLKVYYQKGIDEEAEKIEQAVDMPEKVSYEHAIQNKQVELSMRSIQRRMVYIEKLDTPLDRLKSASEELLYWERRAQLLGILKKGVSGISVEAFSQQAKTVIHEHLSQENYLSIDDIEAAPVALEQIWQQLIAKFKTKARRQKEIAAEDKVNQTIGQEICQGNFEHKNMLTALSTETARCLLQWSGKDLYLNELTVLPPAVAQLLAQWPGEWLSMNGLKELPAESARYLSQWPGKRLSLNGLTKLSADATSYLSQWNGEQLEMIGLQSIGGWKNYGTRLYLSETLKRRLESQ